MLKQLLKGRGKPASSRRSDTESALYKSLFEFLIGCITVPANAEQLIQLGSKAFGKESEEVFHTYLLFEKYLTSFEQEQYNRKTLRESVRQRFPVLLQDGSIFNILFVTETEQKNTLAIHFLQPFLGAVRDKFGRAGDGYFERKIAELTELDRQRRDPEAF